MMGSLPPGLISMVKTPFSSPVSETDLRSFLPSLRNKVKLPSLSVLVSVVTRFPSLVAAEVVSLSLSKVFERTTPFRVSFPDNWCVAISLELSEGTKRRERNSHSDEPGFDFSSLNKACEAGWVKQLANTNRLESITSSFNCFKKLAPFGKKEKLVAQYSHNRKFAVKSYQNFLMKDS